MNRRNFLQCAALAIASIPCVSAVASLATEEPLHVFLIDDGGEKWWYAARDRMRARELHVEMNYTEAGVDIAESDITDCGMVPDAKPLTILDVDDKPQVTKPAREWCEGGEGFVGTTCF